MCPLWLVCSRFFFFSFFHQQPKTKFFALHLIRSFKCLFQFVRPKRPWPSQSSPSKSSSPCLADISSAEPSQAIMHLSQHHPSLSSKDNRRIISNCRPFGSCRHHRLAINYKVICAMVESVIAVVSASFPTQTTLARPPPSDSQLRFGLAPWSFFCQHPIDKSQKFRIPAISFCWKSVPIFGTAVVRSLRVFTRHEANSKQSQRDRKVHPQPPGTDVKSCECGRVYRFLSLLLARLALRRFSCAEKIVCEERSATKTGRKKHQIVNVVAGEREKERHPTVR